LTTAIAPSNKEFLLVLSLATTFCRFSGRHRDKMRIPLNLHICHYRRPTRSHTRICGIDNSLSVRVLALASIVRWEGPFPQEMHDCRNRRSPIPAKKYPKSKKRCKIRNSMSTFGLRQTPLLWTRNKRRNSECVLAVLVEKLSGSPRVSINMEMGYEQGDGHRKT